MFVYGRSLKTILYIFRIEYLSLIYTAIISKLKQNDNKSNQVTSEEQLSVDAFSPLC